VETANDADHKGDLLAGSIVDYGRALEKDPFSAEATLKLAVAYDKARRKSCALTMLRRLYQLAENPKFERSANAQIDEIVDPKNKSWFEGIARRRARPWVARAAAAGNVSTRARPGAVSSLRMWRGTPSTSHTMRQRSRSLST